MNTGGISFSEKRVSKNALITLGIGIFSLVGFLILFVFSILSGGELSIYGGLAGCLFVLLSVFGTLWGLFSYDDIKTVQKYKISGISLNVIVIVLGIAIMMI